MKTSPKAGFTIVEVLIAITMLSLGILALASTSGTVTRMMNFARQKTNATAIAQSVLDSLRFRAAGTSPKCTALVNGNRPVQSGFTTSWAVATSGDTRNITVTVTYSDGRANKADTVTSTLFCL